VLCVTDDPVPQVGTDIDLQLLEAAKAGDMEVVRVRFTVIIVGIFYSDSKLASMTY